MQEGRKEEGSLLSLTRSPGCRINRMEEGAAGGVLGLWTQILPRMLVALPQIKPWPFFRTAGAGPSLPPLGAGWLSAVSAGLSPRSGERALGSVCKRCVERI